MERQHHLLKRRERDRKRKEQIRKDQLMIAYIKVKHPLLYKEATEYYDSINVIYKDKKNLRKTPRFREVESTTSNRPTKDHEVMYNDNMVLKIPLITQDEMSDETTNKEAADSIFPHDETPDETTNKEAADSIFPHDETPDEMANKETVDSIFPHIDVATLVQELPNELLEQIISELRADPDLSTLMDGIEDSVEHEERVEAVFYDDDLDIDIDIVDNLLEKELL